MSENVKEQQAVKDRSRGAGREQPMRQIYQKQIRQARKQGMAGISVDGKSHPLRRLGAAVMEVLG